MQSLLKNTEIMKIKSVLFISIAFLLFSCGTHKELTEEATIENHQTLGEVIITDSGCIVQIVVSNDTETIKMYPANLDEQYQKNGMFIYFNYEMSRVMQPSECDVNYTVSVSNVSIK